MFTESDPLSSAIRVLRLITDKSVPDAQANKADQVYLNSLAQTMGASVEMRQSAYYVFSFLESAMGFAQGKGYGTATIKQEVACVMNQLVGKQPLLAVDIGGNVGEYSAELLSRFADLEVHVFEPASINVGKLKQRFAGYPRVSINPLAVSDTNSSAVLFSDEPGSGMASLSKRQLDYRGLSFDCTEDVRTIRFEDYWRQTLDRRPMDIVKLDIEGHELDALRGMGEAINWMRVVQFEFGGCNIDTRTFFKDFFYFFRDKGFTLHRITPLGLDAIERYRETDEYFSTTNFLATNSRIF
jgi:FkbM family methyltransferase